MFTEVQEPALEEPFVRESRLSESRYVSNLRESVFSLSVREVEGLVSTLVSFIFLDIRLFYVRYVEYELENL